MATPEEIRVLLNLDKDDERPLKEALAEQLSSREAPRGTRVRCAWCGHEFVKVRATQQYCQTACKSEFHAYAKRYLRNVK